MTAADPWLTMPDVDPNTIEAQAAAEKAAEVEASFLEGTKAPAPLVVPPRNAEMIAELEARYGPSKSDAGSGQADGYVTSSLEHLIADLAHDFSGKCLGIETLFINGLGWHKWDGRRYAEVPKHEVAKMLTIWASGILNGIDKELGALQKLKREMEERDEKIPALMEAAEAKLKARQGAYRSVLNTSSVQNSALDFATQWVSYPASKFDAEPHLLNCQNGVVDLRTGDLESHGIPRFMTKVTSADYFPGARHADWDKALEALPDEETRGYLQVALGQAITGHKPDDDRARFATGGGANGKSSIFTPVMRTVGDYGVLATDKILLGTAAGSTDMVDLRAVRVALLEELPETGGGNPFLNTTALKKMIGTDRIRARRLYQNNVEFDVTHSMFITTNFEDIAVKETDHGSWRRLLRIPFPLQYVTRDPNEAHERRADPDLRARLERSPNGQHEAVLAWLVAGAVRWYAGLEDVDYGKMPEPPAPVLESTEAWRASQDVIFQFLKREVIEFVKDSYVTQDDLHWSFTQAMDRTDIGTAEFAEKFGRHGMIRDQRAVKPAKKRTGSLNISRPTRGGDRPLLDRTVVWYGIRFSDEFIARGQTEDFFGNV